MRLEDEIKQKKFRNEYHKLAVNILYTHGWIMNLHENVFSKFDLTLQQFNILRILKGQLPQPSAINLLKERMLDKMSDVSRLVDRLEDKGLLKRGKNNQDRRRADIIITEKALLLLKEIDPFINSLDGSLEKLTSDEAGELNRLLDKLRG